VIRRTRKSKIITDIIVATTRDKEDAKIVGIAKKEKVKWYRGSKNNVLARYYQAAKQNNLDLIVRISGDCPCIDPEIIDMVISRHQKAGVDFTSTFLIRTFPHGIDIEVLTFPALKETFNKAKTDFEKQHVCPYIMDRAKIFKTKNIKAPEKLFAPDIRITLDTEEDYALLCLVFDYLFFKNNYFSFLDIINLFKKKPWLKIINKKIVHKKRFKTLKEEVSEAIKILRLQELSKTARLLQNLELEKSK